MKTKHIDTRYDSPTFPADPDVDMVVLHHKGRETTWVRTGDPEAPWTLRRTCPDSGVCHHLCEGACFRVRACAPLSGVFPEGWPDEVLRAHRAEGRCRG